jgi:hypothetical protein
MYSNSFFKISLIVVSVVFLFSCDKDYNSIGDGLIGDNHFGFSHENYNVLSYNQKNGVVQSNNLPVNALGIYDDPVFGTTTANFVTQVTLGTLIPAQVLNNPEIESVVLSIPYFSTLKSTDATTGNNTYELDSIYGSPEGKIKLSVFESGYFLRTLDPIGGFQETQKYFTDQNGDFENAKIGERLNDSINPAKSQNDAFFFDSNEFKETVTTDGVETINRTEPEMRLYLNKGFFRTKIIDAISSGKLATNDLFKEYFRGLYFKVEKSEANPSNLALLNFSAGKITIKYKVDTSETDTTKLEREIVINLTGNTVSLLSNDIAPDSDYKMATDNVNEVSGDEKLYLKGGEGSMVVLELFKETGELDDLRSRGWLINEANLVFHVDQSKMTDSQHPNRIYLYDLNNNRPIVDYALDGTSGTNVKNGQYIFGGLLDKENNSDWIYKFRITNQIRNLIKNSDSTNVKLGVVVTENINNTAFSKLKQSTTTLSKVPQSSVLSPLGTVLYGGAATVPEDKRLKLEIYYTKPN